MAEIDHRDAAGICARYGDQPSALIEILHDLQAASGAVAEPDLRLVAERLNLTRADVHGVMSFYHDFRREPAGRVVVKVCRAESCQATGARALIEDLCTRHGIALGGTSDKGVTIEPVYCLGNCALSPAASVNGALIGRADSDRIEAAVAEAAS